MKKYDAIVIGCGIVGAAVSMELAKYNLKILILEKENDVSIGTSKANSAIIHAGFDPEPGTLMAKLNVRGSQLAKEICEALDVPYKRNGAFVLAFTDEDRAHLRELLEKGLNNGVEGLKLIKGEELHKIEKNLSESVLEALLAPTSSIVSPWEYCLAMTETAIKNGAELKLNSEVIDIRKNQNYKGASQWVCGPEGCHAEVFSDNKEIDPDNSGWIIETKDDEYFSKYVINCAGIDAINVHELFAKSEHKNMPRRGEYFLLDKSEGAKISHTIFQCPNKLGKGVLVSPTVHGNLIVGLNAEDVEGIDTCGTSNTKKGLEYIKIKASESVSNINFSKSIRNFAGVRAVTEKKDFIISESDYGFIDCIGICSPGLSCAPAIGEYILEILQKGSVIFGRNPETFLKKNEYIFERKRIRFNELSDDEKNELIIKDSSYGRVVCRCETITEGEILECMRGIILPVSIDGVKRRVGTGMGRCQGGFCGPRIAELFEEKYDDISKIIMDRNDSIMFFGRTKENNNGGKND